MSQTSVAFSVFTKPWHMPLTQLGEFVAELGFDGVELPVRPGYQVEPAQAARALPAAVRTLATFGLKVASIAAPVEEQVIAACADAGVPIIRTMVGIGAEGYLATEERTKREFAALIPSLERYGVTLGVQNHCGMMVNNPCGLRRLVEDFDPRQVGIVWDAAHNALGGEEPELALDIVWSHLCLVNLKNAYWRRRTGPEAERAEWYAYWTTGSQGLASWPRVVAELKRREYAGAVCLTAEYSDSEAVDGLIRKDISYAKQLFSGGGRV